MSALFTYFRARTYQQFSCQCLPETFMSELTRDFHVSTYQRLSCQNLPEIFMSALTRDFHVYIYQRSSYRYFSEMSELNQRFHVSCWQRFSSCLALTYLRIFSFKLLLDILVITTFFTVDNSKYFYGQCK